MKRIETTEVKEKKARRNKILVGAILILLMVVSTAGYSLMSGDGEDTSKVKEQGFEFNKQDSLWKTTIGGEVFAFRYLPSEVSNVSIDGNYDLNSYRGKVIYYTSNSEGLVEILGNIGAYIIRYQGACLNGSICEDNLPVKNCDENIFIYEPGNDTKVYKNESCVYLVGDSVKAADAFLYKILGVQ